MSLLITHSHSISRKYRQQITDFWEYCGGKKGEIANEHKETFGDDESFNQFDCSDNHLYTCVESHRVVH